MGGKRALVVKVGAIGDVIMTLPGAYALHQQGFEIEWVCGRIVQPLLECYSWVRLYPVDDRAILKGGAWQRTRSIVALWRRLLFRRYELCATLYYDRRYLALTLPIRCRRRIALSRRNRQLSLIAARSFTDEIARILLGAPDSWRGASLTPLRPDRLPASPLSPKTAARRIALIPGGASNLLDQQSLRRWPVESYAMLARQLRQRGWEILLLGGPDDLWVLPHFSDLSIISLIGKLSIPEVISVCDSCDAVVSHDTGPMHLAGLSRARLLAIFGPTNPGNVLPRRRGVVGLWGGHALACRPCYNGKTYAACRNPECIREVSSDLVLEQLDCLLEGEALNARTISITREDNRTS